MDQLSRMADSLASGVPPGSMALNNAALPAGRAQLAGSMPASCGHVAGDDSCDSLGSFEELQAQHGARQGSKYSQATKNQPQSRQSHRNRRSPSSLNRRFPSSTHACPTCDDLIIEETQSAAGSLLSDLSCSELNSDPEAGSESEAELLRAAGASFQGRADRSGLEALHHARGNSCSVSCSDASSPRALDTAPMQRSHATSHHTDMSNTAAVEHLPISSSHHRASAFQHSAPPQMQLSPGSDKDGAVTEDSSCFGSLSASQHSSPRQAHAGRGVAAEERKPNQASEKAAISGSSQDTKERDSHPLSDAESRPETALSHSSRGAQQHRRECSSHPFARQASGAAAQPRDAASHPRDAPTQTQQAHAQTAEGRHSGLSGQNAVPHAARSNDYPSAVDRQSASAHQRSKQQSRPAQDTGTAAQQRLHGSAEADAVASNFGLASLQSVSDGSLKRQSDADAASAASDEDSETDAHAAGQTPLAGTQVLAAWQPAGLPEAEMSESEEEFERTLAHARQLRPSNQPHMHGR